MKSLERTMKEIEWQNIGDTYGEDDIICPYCGYKDIETDGWRDGEHEAVECPECGKRFDLTIETKRVFSTCRSICEMPEDFAMDEEE